MTVTATPSPDGGSAWAPHNTLAALAWQRAATAETVNADAKTHRGLDHLPLRGVAKALGCATRFALTYDILRFITLRG